MKQQNKETLAQEGAMQEPWLQQVVGELRQPVDSAIADELYAVRRTALMQKGSAGGKWNGLAWFDVSTLALWGAALATGVGALLLATNLLMPEADLPVDAPVQAQKSSTETLLEDLSIMSAQEELEFYQELEFIQWLEQQGALDAQG